MTTKDKLKPATPLKPFPTTREALKSLLKRAVLRGWKKGRTNQSANEPLVADILLNEFEYEPHAAEFKRVEIIDELEQARQAVIDAALCINKAWRNNERIGDEFLARIYRTAERLEKVMENLKNDH